MDVSETVFGIASTEKIYDYDSVRTTIHHSFPRQYYSTSTGTQWLAGVFFVFVFMILGRAAMLEISHFQPSFRAHRLEFRKFISSLVY
jgi:hypothetical protein